MAAKRPHDETECAVPDSAKSTCSASKRPRKSGTGSAKPRQHQNAFIDSTFGQKYFFTGQGTQTSVPKDDDLNFEDDSAAMAYLNSVRHQANGIPHLLVAPKVKMGPELPADFARQKNGCEPEHYDDDRRNSNLDIEYYYHDDIGNDDSSRDYEDKGYYKDGAYTAIPQAASPEDPNTEIDPKQVLADAYYSSIIERFHVLRAILHSPPPKHLVDDLPKTQGYFVGTFGARSPTFVIWNKRLLDSDPQPVQLAAMEKAGVLRVLRVLMGGKFLRLGHEVRERTARWLWALLARLPDPGEMQHTEIAWIRDLGRRAVLMTKSLAEMGALRDELVNGGANLSLHDVTGESDTDSNVLVEMEVNDGDDSLIQPNACAANLPATGATIKINTGKELINEVTESTDTRSPTPNPARNEDRFEDQAMVMSDEETRDTKHMNPITYAKDLERAKTRLLAQLSNSGHTQVQEPETTDPAVVPAETTSDLGEVAEALAAQSEHRGRVNMRHTLNMILTVAGEVYGQRDLLEFRSPFPSL
ncbi:hypothetical protein BROUX41_000907 [Berkeleyomyces rouxiae]|uniref:uncharacterized protein n=1 Tax=Berkeleyomyces rouxiae TaxID=2035830 RepID=UPI003B7A3DAC